MPSPSIAPLLALEAIVNARYMQTEKQEQILYLLRDRGCAMEYYVTNKNGVLGQKIILQGFQYDDLVFVVGQTNDDELQYQFNVGSDPFILDREKDLQRVLANTVIDAMGIDPYNSHLQPDEVPYQPTFNAPEFTRADVLQKLPKLPASVFKILMKTENSQKERMYLAMIARAIEMIRWNVLFKIFQEEKFGKSLDLPAIGAEELKTLFKKINITGFTYYTYDELNSQPKSLSFEFTGVPGKFEFSNEKKYPSEALKLFFDNPYLHLQREIGLEKFLLPHDFVNLLYQVLGGKKATLHEKKNTSRDLKKIWKDFEEVDPSCQVSDCGVVPRYSAILHNTNKFYSVIQLLKKEEWKNGKVKEDFYLHFRFGTLTRSGIYPYFVATMHQNSQGDGIKSYNYWMNGLIDQDFRTIYSNRDQTLPWLYGERLKSITKEILAGTRYDDVLHLEEFSENQIVVTANMKMKLKENTLKMKHINEQLKINGSNFHLWMLKVKFLEQEKDFTNAFKCMEIVLDLIEDETADIHEKLYFRHKFMKKYEELKKKRAKYRSLSQEEALMLFIYHPTSVTYAQKFQESSEEFKFGLDLLENIESESLIHPYPIQEIATKILSTTKFTAIPSIDDQFVKSVANREGFFLPEHFYRVKIDRPKKIANVFWYFTHPMNIPSILEDGITIEEGHAAYFYSCFMNYAIAAHQFGVDRYCVTTASGNKFFAALLVEVDIEGASFTQSMPHLPIREEYDQIGTCVQVGDWMSYFASGGKYKIADTNKTVLKFHTSDTNLVMVFDKSHIGAVRYFGIVLKHDNSAFKILNVSMANSAAKKSAKE